MKVGTCTSPHICNAGIYYNKTNPNYHPVKFNNNCSDTVCFTAKDVVKFLKPVLINTLPPIKTEEEYLQILEKIKSIKTIKDEIFWEYDKEPGYYRPTLPKYIGLLPYCGGQDVSYYINRYLGGVLPFDLKSRTSEKNLCNIIRALDYSLKCLDEEYGKYKGIVYRSGYFNPESKQYASTSISPRFAASVNGYFAHSIEYSVIRTKNAHKILEFQKKSNSPYAKTEKEILIDWEDISTYKYLSWEDYDEELINAVQIYAKCLYNNIDSSITKMFLKSSGNKFNSILNEYKLDNIMKKIKVYSQD